MLVIVVVIAYIADHLQGLLMPKNPTLRSHEEMREWAADFIFERVGSLRKASEAAGIKHSSLHDALFTYTGRKGISTIIKVLSANGVAMHEEYKIDSIPRVRKPRRSIYRYGTKKGLENEQTNVRAGS